MGNTVPEKKGEEKKKPLSRWEGREEFASTPSPECLAPANKEMSFPKLKSYTAPGNTLGFQPSHPPSRLEPWRRGRSRGPGARAARALLRVPRGGSTQGSGPPGCTPHTRRICTSAGSGGEGARRHREGGTRPPPRGFVFAEQGPPPIPTGIPSSGGGAGSEVYPALPDF